MRKDNSRYLAIFGCRMSRPALRNWASIVSLAPFHSKEPDNEERRASVSPSKPSTLPTSPASVVVAIGDAFRGLGGAFGAVFLIQVLNDTLALIARRQIEVDV